MFNSKKVLLITFLSIPSLVNADCSSPAGLNEAALKRCITEVSSQAASILNIIKDSTICDRGTQAWAAAGTLIRGKKYAEALNKLNECVLEAKKCETRDECLDLVERQMEGLPPCAKAESSYNSGKSKYNAGRRDASFIDFGRCVQEAEKCLPKHAAPNAFKDWAHDGEVTSRTSLSEKVAPLVVGPDHTSAPARNDWGSAENKALVEDMLTNLNNAKEKYMTSDGVDTCSGQASTMEAAAHQKYNQFIEEIMSKKSSTVSDADINLMLIKVQEIMAEYGRAYMKKSSSQTSCAMGYQERYELTPFIWESCTSVDYSKKSKDEYGILETFSNSKKDANITRFLQPDGLCQRRIATISLQPARDACIEAIRYNEGNKKSSLMNFRGKSHEQCIQMAREKLALGDDYIHSHIDGGTILISDRIIEKYRECYINAYSYADQLCQSHTGNIPPELTASSANQSTHASDSVEKSRKRSLSSDSNHSVSSTASGEGHHHRLHKHKKKKRAWSPYRLGR